MYNILKKLLPVAEECGSVGDVHLYIRERKYYDSDEIRIEGVDPEGKKFTLRYELEDKKDDS